MEKCVFKLIFAMYYKSKSLVTRITSKLLAVLSFHNEKSFAGRKTNSIHPSKLKNRNFQKGYQIRLFLLEQNAIFCTFLCIVRYLPYNCKKCIKIEHFFKRNSPFFNLERIFRNGIRALSLSFMLLYYRTKICY